MYDICHPSYYKISQLGCKNELKITTAFYVYMELCEEKKCWDVEYKYKGELDLIYLTGKINKNGETEIYIPWPSKKNIKLRDLENIHNQLGSHSFTLAIKSGEGVSILYKVSQGLTKPLAPQETNEKRESIVKKLKLDAEITKNSRNLYQLAKSRQTKSKGSKEVTLYEVV
ncbi:tRNA-splicing endonuclease subunit Sen15 [Microplitis demolitor]|uniref:tRNA-splicing endonuclease subunit Sen15 n=1 Tax=Microplitis demolitor TaxID=69319 RepID=UPI0004CC9FD2|nr:tRNA-splicing endonuclease subunit Sen15 [Microplitis demolitor]